MTPHELIEKLTNQSGPCGRWCAYCDEVYDVAEVKECIEEMYKEIYRLQADKNRLLEDLLSIRKAYKKTTGKEYAGESL